MIKVINISSRRQLPRRKRHLVVEWSSKGGTTFFSESGRYQLKVGKAKHAFWSIECFHLARRLEFDEIFYLGEPDFSTSTGEV
ncbi:MAG: hypothetical protein DI565_09225 [Ancylobacter novellus]|uniref:Uncharacterized protein n=1 Tax=Ancylobacter novellus TaxID=921 RepID=A0A2W5KGE9_ANCNO|nr:MAG: hypothetical protein DI565_09225 [Ancylobacter novellus]